MGLWSVALASPGKSVLATGMAPGRIAERDWRRSRHRARRRTARATSHRPLPPRPRRALEHAGSDGLCILVNARAKKAVEAGRFKVKVDQKHRARVARQVLAQSARAVDQPHAPSCPALVRVKGEDLASAVEALPQKPMGAEALRPGGARCHRTPPTNGNAPGEMPACAGNAKVPQIRAARSRASRSP